MRFRLNCLTLIIYLILSACAGVSDTEVAPTPEAEPPPVAEEAPAPLPTPAPAPAPEVIKPEPVPVPVLQEQKAFINDDKVNFRKEPSTDADIISVLNNGQELVIISTDGDWANVRIEETKGYVHTDYITIQESATKPQSEQITDDAVLVDLPGQNTITIALDPGHQAKGNFEEEPIGPGSATVKPKVAAGTKGVTTGVPEHVLTLDVSLKLRDELIARGYNVFMIREIHEVDISNAERAKMAADAGADIFVRIHADGMDDKAVNGITTLCPTANNPFVPELYERSYALSKNILDALVTQTGAKSRGISKVDNMTGINWSTMPVTIVEMGFMTNAAEDELMQTENYQAKIAAGIANGIDVYFYENGR